MMSYVPWDIIMMSHFWLYYHCIQASASASASALAEEMSALPFHSEVEIEMVSENPRKSHALMSDWTEEVPDYLSKEKTKR